LIDFLGDELTHCKRSSYFHTKWKLQSKTTIRTICP